MSLRERQMHSNILFKEVTEEKPFAAFVNASFKPDGDMRKKSIELFYQMINQELEKTTNFEQVSFKYNPPRDFLRTRNCILIKCLNSYFSRELKQLKN